MSKKAHICMNIGSLTSETIIEALSKKLEQMDKQVRDLQNRMESQHISLMEEMERKLELLKENDSLRHQNNLLREENDDMRIILNKNFTVSN